MACPSWVTIDGRVGEVWVDVDGQVTLRTNGGDEECCDVEGCPGGAQQRGTVGAVFDGAAGDVVEVVRFLARVCTLVGNQLTVVHEALATQLTLVGFIVSVSSYMYF